MPVAAREGRGGGDGSGGAIPRLIANSKAAVIEDRAVAVEDRPLDKAAAPITVIGVGVILPGAAIRRRAGGAPIVRPGVEVVILATSALALARRIGQRIDWIEIAAIFSLAGKRGRREKSGGEKRGDGERRLAGHADLLIDLTGKAHARRPTAPLSAMIARSA